MKKVLAAFLRVLLVIILLIVLGLGFLVGRWLPRQQDPLSFLPERYVAFVQLLSIRAIYDDWLNLSAADVILSRPELAPYRSALADTRDLALARSPIVRKLMDVHADVVLLPDKKLLAVLDLGWRGIFWGIVLRAERNPGLVGMYRARYTVSPVADVPVDAPRFEATLGVVEREIMNLPDGVHFQLDGPVTGMEYLQMLTRLQKMYP